MLIVQRYDRAKTPGGGLARVHQEDMAQALGRTQKYERDGGPSASEIARVPGVVPGELLERLVLNWMLGNADGHAKNLAVLEPATAKARLAPAYDVLCTETYPELDLEHALTIGGAIYPGQVSAETDRASRSRARTRHGSDPRDGGGTRRTHRRGGRVEDTRPERPADHDPGPRAQQGRTRKPHVR